MPPTPPVDDYDAAAEWFRSRLPMKKSAWKRLTDGAKTRAFTVSGVTQLDLVNDVWKALDKAITKGESLEDFKKRVGGKLRKAWGFSKDQAAYRMEIVFRTNVQAAYSAGRMRQLRDPVILRSHPFWKSTAILDGRTSEICRRIGTVILRANHPWFGAHTPPLHHQCRRTVVPLTEKAAKRQGIKTRGPRVQAADGFGGDPGGDWQPDLRKYPPPLVKIYRTG